VYGVDYLVTDKDGNTATAHRVVVVNDGGYIVGKGTILRANSFVAKLGDVATDPADIKEEIMSRSGAVAINGGTGLPIGLDGDAVTDDGDYKRYVGTYDITIGAPDPVSGVINKGIKGKVVDADVIAVGPQPPLPGETDRYYVYGNNITLKTFEAQAIKAAGNYEQALLTALGARADRVTGKGEITEGPAAIVSDGGFAAESKVYHVIVKDAGSHVTAKLEVTVTDGEPPELTVPETKVVSIGAIFGEPEYLDGVGAEDPEDGPAPPSAISHDSPVDTSTTSAFKVTYSVTDNDRNTVTKSGVVLVGDWIVASGYAISAHDFAREIGAVMGDDAEIIAESKAKAVDLRQVLPDGSATPDFGAEVLVIVQNAGGYHGKTPGTYGIELAVAEQDDVTKKITATVGKGTGPVIKFTDYPLVFTQSPATSMLTTAMLKAGMTAIDPEDGDVLAAPAAAGGKGTTATPVGVDRIDRHNIGVYKVSYTATDRHGNSVTRSRAVVITDGRYEIDADDDGDETNDIIIGARSFVAKASVIDGGESQARSLSYAEAFDGAGAAKAVSWTGAPSGYAQTDILPGDYKMTWRVAGYTKTKAVTATIVNADEVYPSGKNGQYAIAANHFLKKSPQAEAMLGEGLDANLIAAANARVFKLVEDTDPLAAGNQPLPDRAVLVRTRGSDLTGPFSAKPNTYPIDFVIQGISTHHVVIDGMVSEGLPPTLTVTTPDEVAAGGVYGAARYLNGVSAVDPDGDKHGTADPSDDTPANITSGVKYGTLTGRTFTEGAPVVATQAGVYAVDYRVIDSDGDRADKRRVVVVNDGSYTVGAGNILRANSFVTRLEDVTPYQENLKAELRSKAGAAAVNGATGIPFDLEDEAVTSDSGYGRAAGTYDVTITAPDAPSGVIHREIKAKVVEADVIAADPQPQVPGETDRWYVYGNNRALTTSEAQAILAAGNYEEALLTALSARVDRAAADGSIEDAAAAIENDGGFAATSGAFRVLIRDAGSHVTAELRVTVTNGACPAITADPVPLVIDAVAASGNLTREQLLSGVKVNDAEDTGGVDTDWNALPAGRQVQIVGGMPAIPQNEKSVTKLTYNSTDAEGNPAEVSRAVVVNDGRYKRDGKYLLEANSFVIGKSQVAQPPYDAQLLEKSSAKAWAVDGTPAVVEVKSLGSYRDAIGSHSVVIGIAGYADMTKQIEAKVIDDADPPGGGSRGENGDSYSIEAAGFRVNLTDAAAWQGESEAVMNGRFLTRAQPVSYLRASQQNALIAAGTPRLESVKKKDNAAIDFRTATPANGDIFLATFYVGEEPDTKVAVEVVISDANPPALTVPETKVVSVGAVFGQSAYMDGVGAADVEDGAIPQNRISHDSPVNTATEAAFKVTYSVTDSDHNTVMKAGAVLVGDWTVVSGYAISAHDFAKEAGEVDGNEAEVLTESKAKAIDVRQILPDGSDNPNFGNEVQLEVKDDGGYYAGMPGPFDIVLAVTENDDVTKVIRAEVGKGDFPGIAFTDYPLVFTQSADSEMLTEGALKSGMTATDPEDGDVLAAPATAGGKGTTAAPVDGQIDRHEIGVYKVGYTATDRHGNSVTRERAVVVTDGRYDIDADDDGDETNDLIIGARHFVEKASAIDGSESQAASLSCAEAFDGKGGGLSVSWTGAPAGYVPGNTAPGDYGITWQAAGHAKKKTIKAVAVGADEIYPPDRNGQYAIAAGHFLKNTTQAKAMLGAGLDANLIAAANARAFALVDGAPDKDVLVLSKGSMQTGEFSGAPKTYPIDFGIDGLSSHHVVVNGVVSDGLPPGLIVSTPDEVTKGALYGEARYRNGVEATDPDGNDNGTPNNPADDKPRDLTAEVKYGTLTATPSGPALTEGMPVIATQAGVYGVDYLVTDKDGNTATAHRVVVVNDGGYVVGKDLILKADSFVTRLQDVTPDPAGVKEEIISKSGATAVNGGTGLPISLDGDAVTDDGGYKKATGTYDITVSAPDPVSGVISKGIRGKVVDADVIAVGPQPPLSGETDRYYVYGNNIKLRTFEAQAILDAAGYEGALLAALGARSDRVTGKGEITEGPAAIADDGGFAATSGAFRVVIRDAGNHVAAELLATVTDGVPPELTVPETKFVSVGAIFGEAEYLDGVGAADFEDGPLPQSEIKRDSPVDTAAEAAFKVMYSVTDSDRNTVTKNGMVFVGDWIVRDGYAINAHDFTKRLGEVEGREDEALGYADAKAVDARQTLPDGSANPHLGREVPVKVKNAGGYYGRTRGTFTIEIAVKEKDNVTKVIAAYVHAGVAPRLFVPDYKRINKGDNFPIGSRNDASPSYLQGVYATDAEDDNGVLSAKITHTKPVAPGVEGSYLAAYQVTDSDGNRVARTGVVLVGSWTIGAGYAINAYDFSRKVGQVVGTSADMIGFAKATAIGIDPAGPHYGKPVAVIVANHGGYPDKKTGKFNITFAVEAEPGVKRTIVATVMGEDAPTLTVPAVRTIPEGAAFDYMADVIATDPEDGNLTSKVTHDRPVNTDKAGAYKVTYSVTDSEGNTVTERGVALVGDGWVIKGGYALYAQDFARKLSAITGTGGEAKRLAKAVAVRIADRNAADFGAHVAVAVASKGGYKKAAGNYKIKFAVAAKRSVTKTIRASIEGDKAKAASTPTPKPPVVRPPAAIVNPPAAPPAPAPPAPAAVPAPAAPAPPRIVEVPAPQPAETPPTVIGPTSPPTTAPAAERSWHLVDLLLVAFTLALGFFLMAYAIRRRDEYDEQFVPQERQDVIRERQIGIWGQLGIILGIMSVVALLLTQDFSADMNIVDTWTVLFAVICGACLLAAIGVTSGKEREWIGYGDARYPQWESEDE
jgi:hypothetical protein